MLSEMLCPSAVGECLVEYAQVFLGSQRVAAHDVALRQPPHHADVAVVGRKDVGHHRCPLGEGHVAQQPVELVLVDDGQPGRLGAYPLKGAQVVGGEVHQVVGQPSAPCLHQVVEEEHLVVPRLGAAHHLLHLVVVAEVVLIVDGEVLLQDEVGLLYPPDVRIAEEEPGEDAGCGGCPRPPLSEARGEPEQRCPA